MNNIGERVRAFSTTRIAAFLLIEFITTVSMAACPPPPRPGMPPNWCSTRRDNRAVPPTPGPPTSFPQQSPQQQVPQQQVNRQYPQQQYPSQQYYPQQYPPQQNPQQQYSPQVIQGGGGQNYTCDPDDGSDACYFFAQPGFQSGTSCHCGGVSGTLE
jgi:hypothetical protein